LLEIIGLAKSPIGTKQIISSMKKYYPDSSGRYLYERISELTPQTDETLGTRLFCIEDKFTKEQCESIIKKLKKVFPYDFQFRELKSHKSYLQNDSKQIRVVELQDDKYNKIKIEIHKQEKR